MAVRVLVSGPIAGREGHPRRSRARRGVAAPRHLVMHRQAGHRGGPCSPPPQASRAHARLYWEGAGWTLADNGSRNGAMAAPPAPGSTSSTALALPPGPPLSGGAGRDRCVPRFTAQLFAPKATTPGTFSSSSATRPTRSTSGRAAGSTAVSPRPSRCAEPRRLARMAVAQRRLRAPRGRDEDAAVPPQEPDLAADGHSRRERRAHTDEGPDREGHRRGRGGRAGPRERHRDARRAHAPHPDPARTAPRRPAPRRRASGPPRPAEQPNAARDDGQRALGLGERRRRRVDVDWLLPGTRSAAPSLVAA